MKTAQVGKNTKLRQLGYRHSITFSGIERGRWLTATDRLTNQFGYPARRRHFRIGSGSLAGQPVVPEIYESSRDRILNADWFSDTRHWDSDRYGYWIAFRDERKFHIALMIVGDIQ